MCYHGEIHKFISGTNQNNYFLLKNFLGNRWNDVWLERDDFFLKRFILHDTFNKNLWKTKIEISNTK